MTLINSGFPPIQVFTAPPLDKRWFLWYTNLSTMKWLLALLSQKKGKNMKTVYVESDSLAMARGSDGYIRLGCFPGQETVRVVSAAYKPTESRPVVAKPAPKKKGWLRRHLGL